MATRDILEEWFDRGVKLGATHMIVVCDSFDYEDYPVFVLPSEDVYMRAAEYNDKNMQRIIMGVYNLSMDKEEQLKQARVFNY